MTVFYRSRRFQRVCDFERIYFEGLTVVNFRSGFEGYDYLSLFYFAQSHILNGFSRQLIVFRVFPDERKRIAYRFIIPGHQQRRGVESDRRAYPEHVAFDELPFPDTIIAFDGDFKRNNAAVAPCNGRRALRINIYIVSRNVSDFTRINDERGANGAQEDILEYPAFSVKIGGYEIFAYVCRSRARRKFHPRFG